MAQGRIVDLAFDFEPLSDDDSTVYLSMRCRHDRSLSLYATLLKIPAGYFSISYRQCLDCAHEFSAPVETQTLNRIIDAAGGNEVSLYEEYAIPNAATERGRATLGDVWKVK